MNDTVIVAALLGLTLLSLGAAAWLMIDRSRLIQRLAESLREHSDTEEEIARTRIEIEKHEQRERAATERVHALDRELAQLTERLGALDARRKSEIAQVESLYQSKLEAEHNARRKSEESLEQRLNEMREQFKKTIEATAGNALKNSSEQFLKLASEHFEGKRKDVEKLVAPISETLKKTDEKLAHIEKVRTENHAALRQQIEAMQASSASLKEETLKLSAALRKPQVRGRYGEIQLERVAELAGMRSYCDFNTQDSSRDRDGNLKRPDMVVRLPNERVIAVDAKTNIEAYLDALEAERDEDRERHLSRFARHVREQAEALSKKSYAEHIDGALDFVVMFIPGDQFVDAALAHEPKLLELAATNNIIIASPSTLIGLLRAVHVGWREKQLSERAAELFELGKELHERAGVAIGHAAKVGEAIDTAGRRYNDFVGSVDARLLPTIRKFEDAGASSAKQIEQPKPVETTVREIKSPSKPTATEGESQPELIETGSASPEPARRKARPKRVKPPTD
ncbi:MAG: DNA recombination protein RmuC [Planctomycetota bacterium]